MKIGISKKIVAPSIISLFFILVLVILSSYSFRYYTNLLEESERLTNAVEFVGDFQMLINEALMPVHDYLISGDEKDREIFARKIIEGAHLFENVKRTTKEIPQERALIKEMESDFISLQQKALILLSISSPASNTQTTRLMKEIDIFAHNLKEKGEIFHTLIKKEIEDHHNATIQHNKLITIVFLIVTLISFAGTIWLVFMAKNKIVNPILEFTKATDIISQGNLNYQVNIKTGDEIELLSNEFNNMTQGLKVKTEEAKKLYDMLANSNKQLERNIIQLYTLYNISKSLSTESEMDKLLNQVVKEVSHALKVHRMNIMLVNDDRTEMSIVAGFGMPHQEKDVKVKLGEGIYGLVSQTGQAEVFNDLKTNPRFKAIHGIDDDTSSVICAPFKGHGQVIGIVNAYKLGGESFDTAAFELLMAASNQVGIALENARLFEETRFLSITDGLTALYNRRYFMERLAEEFDRSKRYKRQLSIILIDIDHFKKFNDANGHPEGDYLLRSFAEIMKKIARKSDVVARYGGEEFIIILPETDKEMATITAERLRSEVEKTDFKGGQTQFLGRVTISSGVASFQENTASFEELIKMADDAMYRAKEDGRNRVCSA
jgi:diguanylate cyclase (GGDEF)-like protein